MAKGRRVSKRRVARRAVARLPPKEFMLPPVESEKYVAVYGMVSEDGRHEIRRYELAGTGRRLREAVSIAVMHPPKTRFVRAWAEDFINYPHAFVGRGHWIGREVESG